MYDRISESALWMHIFLIELCILRFVRVHEMTVYFVAFGAYTLFTCALHAVSMLIYRLENWFWWAECQLDIMTAN